MSLLDSTYFDKVDCNIPQGTYNTIQDHIERYERDILNGILGYTLAKLVLAYTAESDQRIKDIVEGKEYTNGDYLVKWNGLLNTEKVSPLAYAVHAEWLKNTISVQNIGVVQANAENGVVLPLAGMVQRDQANANELFGYVGQDKYAGSLYNFLSFYLSTYPEWQHNEIKIINTLGI